MNISRLDTLTCELFTKIPFLSHFPALATRHRRNALESVILYLHFPPKHPQNNFLNFNMSHYDWIYFHVQPLRNATVIPVSEVSDEAGESARPRLVGKLWNLTKVTVKEEAEARELENLCLVSHPNILLLMAVCPMSPGAQPGLQLVFQHAPLGSLHHWLHARVRPSYIYISMSNVSARYLGIHEDGCKDACIL